MFAARSRKESSATAPNGQGHRPIAAAKLAKSGSSNKTMNEMAAGEDLDMVAWTDRNGFQAVFRSE